MKLGDFSAARNQSAFGHPDRRKHLAAAFDICCRHLMNESDVVKKCLEIMVHSKRNAHLREGDGNLLKIKMTPGYKWLQGVAMIAKI